MRDGLNDVQVVRAIPPAAAITDNTPLVSEKIDRTGFAGVLIAISLGNLAATAASFTSLLQESDTGDFAGEENDVADVDLLGTEALASFDQSADNACRKLGYKGIKRYVRLTITPSGNNAAAYIAVIAVLFGAVQQPTANPPA